MLFRSPKLIGISDDMDAFTDLLWNSLNEENKVSLFVRYIDIETGKYETRIVNKNQLLTLNWKMDSEEKERIKR